MGLSQSKADTVFSSKSLCCWEFRSNKLENVWYEKIEKDGETAVRIRKPKDMSVMEFQQEVAIMKKLDHPNIVKLYAVCTDHMYLITEYLKKGSLLKYLRKGSLLSLEIAVRMAAQLANGMMYLESHKLVHRDLAARNVLVGELVNGIPIVKIASFGLRRQLEVPLRWGAPEVFEQGHSVNTVVWSYGVVLYEIMTGGCTPYPDQAENGLVQKIKEGYRMECPENCPDDIYKCMRACWHPKPEERLRSKELFDFFNTYFDFDQF